MSRRILLPMILSTFLLLAVSAAQSALTEDPDIERAVKLATEARYEQALKLFTSKLRDDPESSLLNYYVGLTHLYLGNKKEAIKFLRKSLAEEAAFPQAYYWCAQAFLASDEMNHAYEVLERGVNEFPRNRKLLDLLEEVRMGLKIED